jgi:putative transposase
VAFVTTTVVDWMPVLCERRLAECTLRAFSEGLTRQRTSCLAYVLMPSHFHAVIGVADYPLVAKFMQSFKIISSKSLKPLLGTALRDRLLKNGKFQFWQPRYDELVILSERQFRRKIEYIHANPVKSGLVRKPEGWAYSSAGDWCGKGPGLVPIDRDFTFQR